MFTIFLASIAKAKDISVPGSYSDIVDSELILAFTPKENFDSFIIFPNTDNFNLNDKPLKHVYTNPSSLTIKSNGKLLNYSFVQLKKGVCESLDFILNKYSNDWYQIKYFSSDINNFCFVFSNSMSSESVFYRNIANDSIYLYDNYILDSESYLNWQESTTISLNYKTLLVQFTPSIKDIDHYFGINNNTQKTNSHVYHVSKYDSFVEGYAIIDEITEFNYGKYDVDVKGEYILTIPKDSVMLITKVGGLSIKAFSGYSYTRDSFTSRPSFLGYSFMSDSYIRITGNNSLSFIILKNSSELLRCKEVITIFGKIDYKLKYDYSSQYCVYAVTNNGDIEVEDDKYAKYFDINGKEISHKDKFENAVVVSINQPKSSSSIKFKVGGQSDYPYVIRNTKNYNDFNVLSINETYVGKINYELRDDSNLGFLKWLVVIIIVGIVLGIALVAGVAYCLIKAFFLNKKQNTPDKSNTLL